MNYQISYMGPSGHAEKLANAFAQILPPNTRLVNMEWDTQVYADTLLVGFELNELSLSAVPYKVMELLDKVGDRTLCVFVTCPFLIESNIKEKMERSLLPFFPEDCDYRGLFVCSGQVSDSLLSNLQHMDEQQPGSEHIKAWLTRCSASIGHPDSQDIQKGLEFVADALKLN